MTDENSNHVKKVCSKGYTAKIHIIKNVGPADEVLTLCDKQMLVTDSDLTDEPVTCKRCLELEK